MGRLSENLYFAKRPGTRKVTQLSDSCYLYIAGNMISLTHDSKGVFEWEADRNYDARNIELGIYCLGVIPNKKGYYRVRLIEDTFPNGVHNNSVYITTWYTMANSYENRHAQAVMGAVGGAGGNGNCLFLFYGSDTSNTPIIPAGSKIRFTTEVFDLAADFGTGNEPTTIAECEAYYGPDYHPYGESYLDDWYAAYSNICKNLFNPAHLLKADGWTMEDLSHYKGSVATLYNLYGESGYPFEKPWKPNTRYAFQCHIKVDGSGRSKNVRVVFVYTDGSSNRTVYVNGGDDLKITLISAAGKTVSRLCFDYSSHCTIHLSNIQVEEGSSISEPEPYKPAEYYAFRKE